VIFMAASSFMKYSCKICNKTVPGPRMRLSPLPTQTLQEEQRCCSRGAEQACMASKQKPAQCNTAQALHNISQTLHKTLSNSLQSGLDDWWERHEKPQKAQHDALGVNLSVLCLCTTCTILQWKQSSPFTFLTLCHVTQVWVDDDDDQAEALAMVVRTGVSLCMFWYFTPCTFELAI